MKNRKIALVAFLSFLMIIGILYMCFGRGGIVTAFSEEDFNAFNYLYYREIGDETEASAEIILRYADPEKLHRLFNVLSNLKYKSKEAMKEAGGYSFTISLYNRQQETDRKKIEILSDTEICIGDELYHLKKGQMNPGEIRGILDDIKEYGEKTETPEVIRGLEEFVAQFTKKPVLYSFTQENTEAVLVFIVHYLEQKADLRLEYEPDYARYTTYISNIQEDIDRLFDINGITGFMAGEIYGYGDRVLFYKHWIPYGGNPILQNVYIKDGRYICEGYIDGVPRYVSGTDSDIVIRRFVAAVSLNENGAYRMYEFECIP
ncbi:MAG: hypothetical protein II694_03920 [Lachnospiraceae bacterium]|nr:hypothetical protein [Lachnospiraceae bacterium]